MVPDASPELDCDTVVDRACVAFDLEEDDVLEAVSASVLETLGGRESVMSIVSDSVNRRHAKPLARE